MKNFHDMVGRRAIIWAGVVCLLGTLAVAGGAKTSTVSGQDWWPQQAVPKAFVSAPWPRTEGEWVMLHALAGLTARAVNEGRGDELVWMGEGRDSFNVWKERTVQRLKLDYRGRFDVWQLLERYRQRSWVKGYVLYRQGTNTSANVATTLAGVLDAVPVEETLEGRAQKAGLQRLADARELSVEEAFEKYRDRCNREQVYMLNPRSSFMRDMVVAHRGFVSFGTNAVNAMLNWALPLTPVVGWNEGDEFKHTSAVSRSAHFHTVSDFSRNLTLLSAGSVRYQPRRLTALNPVTIDWRDQRPCVAFMLSDGDNLSYMMAGIWNKSYWEHPSHGKFPMGFSACLADLAQTAPVVLDKLCETKPEQTSLVQFSGGYFYPDLFAANYTNRVELLRIHARRINAQMRRTGATVMCCIMDKSDSPAAQEALRVFAEEIQPLLGIMVMDYTPYHRMEGKVYWVEDGRGGQVPAVTARYLMWAGMKRRGAGGPSEVAQQINTDAGTTLEPALGWVAVHAWSKFINPATGQEEGGVGAVQQCVETFDKARVRVVSPEELLWRLRMKHDEKAAQKLIAQHRQ